LFAGDPHPKRVLRAILRAADLSVSGPKRAAQLLVEQGSTKRYDLTN